LRFLSSPLAELVFNVRHVEGMAVMTRFLLICSGGALGTGIRYLLSTYFSERFGADFPRGTLFINFTGSFLIAVVMTFALEVGVIPPGLRLFLVTGVLGGYTTYSSFNYETLKLAEQRAWGLAGLYLALTVASCLVAGYLGLLSARLCVKAASSLR
jgi:fluoride exporter